MANSGLTLDDLQIKISVVAQGAGKSIKNLADKLEKAAPRMENATKTLQEVTKQLQALADAAQAADGSLANIVGSLRGLASGSAGAVQNIQDTANAANNAANAVTEMANAANADPLGTVTREARACTEELDQAVEAANSSFWSVAKQEISRFGDALRDLKDRAMSLGGGVLPRLGNSLKSAFTAPIRSVGNLLGKLGNLWGMIKRIAMYRMIRTGIKLVTQALREGTQMLVEWDRTYGNNTSRAAQTTDEIAQKWREVKKALGAAAMPILQVFQPALMGLMNMVIAVANTINQIVRSLQGYSTYMRATEKDWKSSVGSAKELQRILFGFDELNVLPSPNGGGSTASVGGLDFVETDLDSGFAQSAGKRIGSFIENLKSDWQEFVDNVKSGESLIGSVIGFVKNVFADLGQFVGGIFIDLGKAIKGFTEKLGLEGTTIGNIIGIVGDLFIHFGELVQGIFTLDLPKILVSVRNIFNDLLKLTDQGLVGLNHAIDSFLVWLEEKLGVDFDDIRILVGGLFTAIRAILGIGLPAILGTLFGWGADIINFFKNIFGEKGLPQIFNGLIQFIEGIFTGDWKKAWDGVVNVFKGIGNVIISVAEFIANAFITPFQAIGRAINNFKVNIPEWIPLIGGKSWNPQISVPQKISIPRLAEGGLVPNAGSLFWAGESGTELVMNAGNNTAVLNAAQIEEAMTNANAEVINAIYAMANMVVGAVNNKDFDVYMDAQKVGKSVSQYQYNVARQYGG